MLPFYDWNLRLLIIFCFFFWQEMLPSYDWDLRLLIKEAADSGQGQLAQECKEVCCGVMSRPLCGRDITMSRPLCGMSPLTTHLLALLCRAVSASPPYIRGGLGGKVEVLACRLGWGERLEVRVLCM
jgi:hypothetical protein